MMSCKQLRGDMNYAWPTAEIAVMGGAGVRSARHPAAQSNGFVAVGVRISEDQREIALDTPHQRARRRECSVGEVAGTLRDMDRIGVSGEIDIDRTRALAAAVHTAAAAAPEPQDPPET